MLKKIFGSKKKSAADSICFLIGFALCLFCFVQTNQAQTTAFTYQGKLTEGGTAANGQYDFAFALFTDVSGGAAVGLTVSNPDVQVTSGIFTVNLDFGNLPFTSNAARFLEIYVRPGAPNGGYTTLAPRQPITSSPFAIKTISANSADSLSATCALCVTDAQISSIDGAKITGIVNQAATAANVSGIVPIANGGTGSPTKNFVDLTSDQTILGNKTFSGTLAGDGSGLTNVNAAVANGSITTAKLADGSVTAAKLAPEAIVAPASNLALLGSLRWDLLRGQRDFAAGTSPRGVAFDGANMWVAISGGNIVVKFRISDGAILGSFAVGSLPLGLAFDGANIWVTNLSSNNVMKLRASDGANLGTFAVNTPTKIAYDGANMWIITGGAAGAVTKLRASDGANLGSFPIAGFSEAMAFDGANMWITNRIANTVTKLRTSDGVNLGTFPAGANPRGVAFDGVHLWIVNLQPAGIVIKLRISDGSNLGSFSVGFNPSELAFDGTNIWVSNGGGNSVTKLRAADGANLGVFPVGGAPAEIAFDGANIWVSQSGGITRLSPAFP